MYALLIVVILNGQEWEAIPNVYKSEQDCQQAAKQYKDIADYTSCFPTDESKLHKRG